MSKISIQFCHFQFAKFIQTLTIAVYNVQKRVWNRSDLYHDSELRLTYMSRGFPSPFVLLFCLEYVGEASSWPRPYILSPPAFIWRWNEGQATSNSLAYSGLLIWPSLLFQEILKKWDLHTLLVISTTLCEKSCSCFFVPLCLLYLRCTFNKLDYLC